MRAPEGFRDVIVVPNAYDRGLAGARNSGAVVGTGNVLAFMDDDVEPSQDWLEHIKPRRAGPRPGWVVGCTFTGLTETTKTVRNLSGANMSMGRDVLVRAGGFRSDFGKVGTKSLPHETKLCLRASRLHRGRVWLHVAPDHVSHHVPTPRGSIRYFASPCWNESIGKARLWRAEGSATALESERAYRLNTVAAGAARGVVHIVPRRDLGGIARSPALLFGVLATVGAYVPGRGRLLAAQR